MRNTLPLEASSCGLAASPSALRTESDWSWVLFVLLTAALVIRPQEVFPTLQSLRIYAVLAVLNLAFCWDGIIARLSNESLRQSPLSLVVLGLFPAILFSHLASLRLELGFDSSVKIAELLAYFLIAVSVVNTKARLESFIGWLGVVISIASLASLLDYADIVDLQGEARFNQRDFSSETEQLQYLPRLQSFSGFGDPNDFAIVLVLGILISLHNTVVGGSWRRVGWCGCLVICVSAFVLTRSRGGFVTCVVGLGTYLILWRGPLVAMLMSLAAVPLVAQRLGRMSELAAGFAEGETGSTRLVLWELSLDAFSRSPVFGIGQGMYQAEFGHVVHNSYLECYAELGFFGGSLFLAAFLLTGTSFERYRQLQSPSLGRCLVAMLLAYGVGLMSVSRTYFGPTYILFGLGVCCQTSCSGRAGIVDWIDDHPYTVTLGASVAFVGSAFFVLRVLVP